MAIDFPGSDDEEQNLFSNKRTDRGGEAGIFRATSRRSEIVVSQNGTGDFETVEEGLNELTRGDTLFIKQGTYVIKSTLIIPSNNIIIKGEGNGTVIQNPSTINQDVIDTNGKDGVKIENIKIENLRSTDNPAGILIKSGSEKCRVLNCDIFAVGPAITTQCTNSFIINCFIESTGSFGQGIFIDSGTDDLTISNCFITAPNGSNPDGIIILAEGTTNRLIINNCNISDCAHDGISILGNTENIIITNCIISGNRFGIVFETDGDHSKNIISNNQLISNSSYGLQIGNTSDRTLTHGNIVLNNTIGQINDNGTNSLTTDNIIA